jgi:hypothetical protein
MTENEEKLAKVRAQMTEVIGENWNEAQFLRLLGQEIDLSEKVDVEREKKRIQDRASRSISVRPGYENYGSSWILREDLKK